MIADAHRTFRAVARAWFWQRAAEGKRPDLQLFPFARELGLNERAYRTIINSAREHVERQAVVALTGKTGKQGWVGSDAVGKLTV